MPDAALRVPSSNAGWLWHRLRARFDRRPGPRVAIVFGETTNRGDLSLAESLLKCLPDCRLYPYCYPAKERYLRRMGLSGPAQFSGLVLGGGTLINEMGIGPVREAIRQGLPVWIMGTGVGQGAYYIPENPDLSEWLPLLKKCRRVAVRGPRSQARLVALGFPHATQLADTALSLTPEQCPDAAKPGHWAINVIQPSPYQQTNDWSAEHLEGLIRLLRWLHAGGHTFQPFGMVDDDVVPTAEVLRRAGIASPPVALPRNSADAQNLLSTCSAGISMRLHGAVLGNGVGIPTVKLGYMEKNLDFAESLHLEALHVPIREASEDRLFIAVKSCLDLAARGRSEIWTRAHTAKKQILAFGQEIQHELRHRPAGGTLFEAR